MPQDLAACLLASIQPSAFTACHSEATRRITFYRIISSYVFLWEVLMHACNKKSWPLDHVSHFGDAFECIFITFWQLEEDCRFLQ
jgi:hypothetical protein